MRGLVILAVLLIIGGVAAWWFFFRAEPPPDDPGYPLTLAELPEISEDVFQPMDGAIAFSPDEIKGRNTWNLWTGGNQQFWDRMARESYGLSDLLKMLDSSRRGSRFEEMGLINEPGFTQASKKDQYGLWLDEGPEGLPGVSPEKFKSAYEKAYGRSSGVLGFRLFPNPNFDAAAEARWNQVKDRYYTDPTIGTDSTLVRPYRVGVACGSCHIAFHPLNPPADPENPKWENLSSTIGNQYIREGRVFASSVNRGGFLWQMIETQPAGTSDTSRVATDHINNPNAINPIFLLGERLRIATPERLSAESLLLPTAEKDMKVPHVLKDGADSVGVVGATLRVYVNIGMYGQHWVQQHQPLIGLTEQKPFSIKFAQEHSVYWKATETKFGNIGKFFTRIRPMKLASVPEGQRFLTGDQQVLAKGRQVFAETCAQCHSSRQPPLDIKEDARTKWFKDEVEKDSFWEDNFLSDDQPYSLSLIETNAGRALGTNAMQGHIWSNFSSDTYKNREKVAPITVYNPYADKDETFAVGGGGRGYYRTPSLIAVWSSAPFFHNNSLGMFEDDDERRAGTGPSPSIAARMKKFDDAVRKLLWPERRDGKKSIWRTREDCQLEVAWKAIPAPLRGAIRLKMKAEAFITKLVEKTDDETGKSLRQELESDDSYFRIAFIPAGTPVNLIANIDPDDPDLRHELPGLLVDLKVLFLKAKKENWTREDLTRALRTEIAPRLWKMNKCPDFVNDRGHDFGSKLSDENKEALIELLKTF